MSQALSACSGRSRKPACWETGDEPHPLFESWRVLARSSKRAGPSRTSGREEERDRRGPRWFPPSPSIAFVKEWSDLSRSPSVCDVHGEDWGYLRLNGQAWQSGSVVENW